MSNIVGYVPGAWDMFHIGHLNILQRAKQLCDELVVGVVTDEAMVAAKAKQPVIPLAERLEIVAAIRVVDRVVVDRSSDKREIWREVRFDRLFKGDDWQHTPKGDRLEAHMAEVGVEVHYFPYTTNTSSTMLRALIDSRIG